MTQGQGTISVWAEEWPIDTGPLTRAVTTDVCVIGAGIAGLSIAHELSRRGRRVIVLEDGVVGCGETGRTTAHLVTALDERYFRIERLHGEAAARSAADSHRGAIERIERIVEEERIDCDFSRVYGVLTVSEDKKDRAGQLLKRELEAATRAGVQVRQVHSTPMTVNQDEACLVFPGQGQFHPMRYLRGLVRGILGRNGGIYTHTRAATVKGGRVARVTTERGDLIEAEAVVVATNAPFNNRVLVPARQSAFRSYVITLRVAKGSLPAMLLWDGYWDDDLPYHYVRTANGPFSTDYDWLVVGGEDHRVGQADDAPDRYARLEAWARRHFAHLGPVEHRWSGQIMEPVDEFALIGHNPMDANNVFIVTGDSGNGMTYGTIAAMLIPDLIDGRENPWAKLYDPGRVTPKSAPEFFKDTGNFLAQYKDWVSVHAARDGEDVPAPGCGVVVRKHGLPVAIYHDPDGTIVRCSAVCPHLKGVVRWNAEEKSWDCPVHGSRFDCHGKVIHGPASHDLAPVDGPKADGVTQEVKIGSGIRAAHAEMPG